VVDIVLVGEGRRQIIASQKKTFVKTDERVNYLIAEKRQIFERKLVERGGRIEVSRKLLLASQSSPHVPLFF
jgi:hypothetical protein